jgi:hypothetical protein
MGRRGQIRNESKPCATTDEKKKEVPTKKNGVIFAEKAVPSAADPEGAYEVDQV